MSDLMAESLQGRVEHAIQRQERVAAFLRAFPPMTPSSGDLLPPISWAQIERQLGCLAGQDFERVPWEMEILRASARLNPPEMFYLDLLRLAWSLVEEAGDRSNPEGAFPEALKPEGAGMD